MDDPLIKDIIAYAWRITPGFILIAITCLLLPRQSTISRIFMLVFAFILVRDAMTPAGYWQFGVSENTIWLRFAEDGRLLVILGAASILFTLLALRLNKSMKINLEWLGTNKVASILVGFVGALVVVTPVLLSYLFVPVEERGGAVPPSLWLPLLFLALSGNWLEEVLFRGYMQGYLSQLTGQWKAVLLSGLLFAVGHIFLSATVTDLGFVVLLFTFYEGLICAAVRMNHGIIASTLTHGTAIFILAAGLY